MIDMTPAAREQFDNYLRRLRVALRGTTGADDVEQNVREHIEIALANQPAPVGAPEVIGVLDRLGSPERWIADEDRNGWRRLVDRVRSGPDDWRLAYLAFGLFLASLVLIPVGIGVLLILPAMFASRAYVELARDRDESLGARRWLVYPAIALVLAVVTGLLLIGPAVAGLSLIFEDGAERLFDVPTTELGQIRFVFGMGGLIFGSWWILFAAFCAAFLRPIRFVFAPLLDGVARRHFAVLAAIGALVAGAGGALVYYRH